MNTANNPDSASVRRTRNRLHYQFSCSAPRTRQNNGIDKCRCEQSLTANKRAETE